MKRKLIALCTALMILFISVFFAACGGSKKEVEPIAIDLTGTVVEEGETLLDIMKDRKAEGKLTFEMTDGMITSINGVANSITYNPCWMLYTSDKETSSEEWGTVEYGGKTLGSATVGAESLLVKTGEIYVWVYQSF